jgi:hypothetical protein
MSDREDPAADDELWGWTVDPETGEATVFGEGDLPAMAKGIGEWAADGLPIELDPP